MAPSAVGRPSWRFTRVATEAILERGTISRPEQVVMADDTLLSEPAAQPLAGCDTCCMAAAAATGARVFTATSNQGLLYGFEMLYTVAG